MWTRKDLKQLGRAAFFSNFWKCVLIAFIITLVASIDFNVSSKKETTFTSNTAESISGISQDSLDWAEGQGIDLSDALLEYGTVDSGFSVTSPVERVTSVFQFAVSPLSWSVGKIESLLGALWVGAGISLSLIIILLRIFVFNVLEVGGCKFFVENSYAPAEVEALGYGFHANYTEMVLTQFLRGLFTVLWTLLFIIPGIVKSYEYCMIPYLLADEPDMTKDEAFARSKEMMNGQKWNTFVLDLSFIGWMILDCFTVGLLGIFFVNPYRYATKAELYRTLAGK